MADTEDLNPIAEQGEAARDLGQTEADCPYGPGENRDAWLKGLNAKPAKKPKPEA